MAKSKPSQEENKPQPRIEVTKSSPKDNEKKAGKDASATAPSSEQEDPSQATVIMQAPSAFEQLVEKILKKHKI